jgi:CMP-N-acetylneuraminic acid synthetase
MNILITICARGGSKGIPGKNIKLLNGLPLIVYTINIAHQFCREYQDVDIALSTDSEEIAKISEQYGIQSNYKRPDSLGGDTVGKIDVIKDVLFFYENIQDKRYDYILDLDVTSPLRNLNDLKESFRIIGSDSNAINLFSVSPANRNPYFNMVEQKENSYYALVKQLNTTYLTRQSSPKIYELNASFYFYKRLFFDMDYKGAITDKSLIYEVPHICFDLDHPIDFEFLSYLISNNKLDFKL